MATDHPKTGNGGGSPPDDRMDLEAAVRSLLVASESAQRDADAASGQETPQLDPKAFLKPPITHDRLPVATELVPEPALTEGVETKSNADADTSGGLDADTSRDLDADTTPDIDVAETQQGPPPPIPAKEPSTVPHMPTLQGGWSHRLPTTGVKIPVQEDDVANTVVHQAMLKRRLAAQVAASHERAESETKRSNWWKLVTVFALGFALNALFGVFGTDEPKPPRETPSADKVNRSANGSESQSPVAPAETNAKRQMENPKVEVASYASKVGPANKEGVEESSVSKAAPLVVRAPETEVKPTGVRPTPDNSQVDEGAKAEKLAKDKTTQPLKNEKTENIVRTPVAAEPIKAEMPAPTDAPKVAEPQEPVADSTQGFDAEVTVGLNMRSGPNQHQRVVASIKAGSTVRALGRRPHNVYIYVQYGERKGWIASFRGYVKPVGEHSIKSLPVVSRQGVPKTP